MIPWELLDRAPVPDDCEELLLYRRGEEYSIRVNRTELMNSRSHGSEEALGELACGRLAACPDPRILIGGLGMGFTTAAALNSLGSSGEVIVAELVPGVVEWNQGILGHLANHPLRDDRVTVRAVDVAHIMKEEPGAFDAILLDVDNGPQGLSSNINKRLYTREGLKMAFSALRPDGVLGIWSASPDREFSHRLSRSGFAVEEVNVRARNHSGGHHTIWLAIRNS
ncbi:MAG: hypothetical protein HQM09_14565 [Candidatus Riflebacteria bacterium]|nr:hypothetical protein [Candidatus Riflebacteria bacterium]